MLSVTRHVFASSNQRRTGMKIQNSWKAAASGPQFIAAHASCDGFFKIFCVELKSSEILIIIDFTISQLPNMSFFLCPTKKQFLLQVHLAPEVWGVLDIGSGTGVVLAAALTSGASKAHGIELPENQANQYIFHAAMSQISKNVINFPNLARRALMEFKNIEKVSLASYTKLFIKA